MQSASFFRKRSISSSIFTIVRHHAKSQSSAPKISFSPCDFLLSIRHFFGIETHFTVHSDRVFTQLIGDQGSVSSLSANNTAEPPYHSIDGHSRLPTTDPYH